MFVATMAAVTAGLCVLLAVGLWLRSSVVRKVRIASARDARRRGQPALEDYFGVSSETSEEILQELQHRWNTADLSFLTKHTQSWLCKSEGLHREVVQTSGVLLGVLVLTLFASLVDPSAGLATASFYFLVGAWILAAFRGAYLSAVLLAQERGLEFGETAARPVAAAEGVEVAARQTGRSRSS